MDLEKLKKLIEKFGNKIGKQYNVEKVVVSNIEKAGGKDHYFVNFHYHMKDGFQPLNRFERQDITGDIDTQFKESTDITLTTMSTSSFSKEGGKNIDMSESKSGVKYIITESKLERVAVEYLNRFYGDLQEYKTEKYPHCIFFIKNKKVLMQYEYKGFYLIVDKKSIWNDLENMFALNHKQIQNVIKLWVKQTYNLDIINVLYSHNYNDFKIKEID